jgi:hypothetical protein
MVETFDDQTIGQDNIEYAVMEAIKKYADTHKLLDMFFWRTAIMELGKKYDFTAKFNEELKRQRKRFGGNKNEKK